MNKMYESVKQFQEAFGQLVDVPFDDAAARATKLNLRIELITEERNELVTAMSLATVLPNYERSIIKKEAADLLYVVVGLFVDFGWDMDAIFDKVHESNMSKLSDDGKPVHRSDGKVLKSSNYKEPDLTGV